MINLLQKIIPLLILILGFTIVNEVRAINMDSTQFQIESGTVNIEENNPGNNSVTLTSTLGQGEIKEFLSNGFVLKEGYQNVYPIVPFSFSISTTSINFGTLMANTPRTQRALISVNFGPVGLYQVAVEEMGKLRAQTGAHIPDTTCNGGSKSCSKTSANLWNSTSAYGFGYAMSGNDIPSDLNSHDYYRPFPDGSLNEIPTTIMSNIEGGNNRQSTITFKANVSPNQESGTYQTFIKFIVTPNF